MATLKLVMVIISIFTQEKDGAKLRDYISQCLTKGMASVLFTSPFILAAFYTAGNTAWEALTLAISDYVNNTNTNSGSIETVRAKMALAVLWLRGYAGKVFLIANDSTNGTTREEAAINIGLSGLKAQKFNEILPKIKAKNILPISKS